LKQRKLPYFAATIKNLTCQVRNAYYWNRKQLLNSNLTLNCCYWKTMPHIITKQWSLLRL